MRRSIRIASLIMAASASLFAGGVGDYKYTDSLDASRSHPGSDSIALEQVPMFISFGWDDNGISDKKGGGGSTWILKYLSKKKNNKGTGNSKTFDGAPVRCAFYMTGKYGQEWVYEDFPGVRANWKKLYKDGHEIGNHSTHHLMKVEEVGKDNWVATNFDGRAYSKEEWLEKEINPCHDLLTRSFSKKDAKKGIGIPAKELKGWRTPRLEWNDSLLSALTEKGYVYDCSMELEAEGDGTNFWWPHTLNNGSPVHENVSSHRGLWEMPAYRFVIPKNLRGEDKVGDSIMTGLDYNVWAPRDWGALELTGPEFTEILKYTLDQRMKGNRAPMLVGVHSDIYSAEKDGEYPGTGSSRNRQKAIEDFIDYAQKTYPEVRIVTPYQIIEWMREPSALGK